MSNKFKLEYSLPYWIPFDHNMYIEKWEADVKYRIWIEEERGVKIVRENQSHYPITVFIIEIEDNIEQTYRLKQFHSETINRIFEHGLNLVNQLIDLIRSDSDLLYLQNIATTDLPPVITLSINDEKFPYITCPHRLIGENRRVISQDQFKSIWRKLDSNESLPYLHYFDKARSDFILGRNSEAIINLQISFESYVRYLIIEFARKENLSEVKTEAVLNSKFRHQIEHFLSKKLCRDLSYDKNSIIIAWRQYVYGPRNSIVHDGKYATTLIARKALKIFIRLHNYISSLANKSLNSDQFGSLNIGSASLLVQKEAFESLMNDKIIFHPQATSLRTRIRFRKLRLVSKINSLRLKLKVWLARKFDNIG